MKPNLKWLTFAAAMIGLGMSMPSCPGQQAIQQQLDSLQTAQAEMQKKLQAQDSQIKTINQTDEQVKSLLEEMTRAIQSQRGALELLAKAIEELKNRPAPTPAVHAAPARTSGKAARNSKKGH